MTAPPRRAVVLFDVDGTLLRGDVVLRFLRHLLRDRPLRRALLWVSLPLWAPTLLWWRSLWLGGSWCAWVATAGRRASALQAAQSAWLQAMATQAGRLRIDETWLALHRHAAAGDRVVLVTGGDAALVAALWSALEGPDVEIIGSGRCRGWLGGWWVPPARHCIGPRKRPALAAAGITQAAAAYTDSARDIPMLALADTGWMVRARPRDAARVRRALGARVRDLPRTGASPDGLADGVADSARRDSAGPALRESGAPACGDQAAGSSARSTG